MYSQMYTHVHHNTRLYQHTAPCLHLSRYHDCWYPTILTSSRPMKGTVHYELLLSNSYKSGPRFELCQLYLHLHRCYVRHYHPKWELKMYLSKIFKAADHPYLYGKGGRFVSCPNIFLFLVITFHVRLTMRWLTWGWHLLVTRRDSGPCLSSAALEPDSRCGIWKGEVKLVTFLYQNVNLPFNRLATVTTDVNWRKTKDDSVTNYYWNRRVKFLNPNNVDYRGLNNKTPIYDEWLKAEQSIPFIDQCNNNYDIYDIQYVYTYKIKKNFEEVK